MRTFDCMICKRTLAQPLRALGQTKERSICVTCYDAGHTMLPPTVNTARRCPACGKKINTGPCHYCEADARRLNRKG